ncbi:MAG: hypothetical protein RJQ14_13430, partial [Marinoscillum sp.]
VHDKRFFAVMGNDTFQKECLDAREREIFEAYYLPTYSSTSNPDVLLKAKKHKDEWIVKDPILGKSQKVHAGILTDQNSWDDLLNDPTAEWVFQEWVPQRKFKGKIDKAVFEDYITGTLMFFNDRYFGLGEFRTSSFPITNKVDHRKASSLIAPVKHEGFSSSEYINQLFN